MEFKLLIHLIGLVLVINTCKGQNHQIVTCNFYLKYEFVGYGSNTMDNQPVIRICNNNLIYTYEQNNSWYGAIDATIKDTICQIHIREGTIDSILNIAKLHIKDSLIIRSNPCIMSGGSHDWLISFNGDTLRYSLINTNDTNAIRITRILNEYLPRDKQIWGDEHEILDEINCYEWLIRKKRRKE